MKKKLILQGIVISSLILVGCGSKSNLSTFESSETLISSSAIDSTSIPSSSSTKEVYLTGIDVIIKSSQTKFMVGDEFVKPTVKAHYTNKDDVDVSDLCTYKGFTSELKGTINITVSYTEDDYAVSTSYDVTIVDYTISFESALAKIASLQAEELNNSNSATTLNTTISGKTKDIESQEIANYKDNSSSSVGTYSRRVGDEVVLSDNFKEIKTKVTDKYRFDDGAVESYDMFVDIKDYEYDASSNYYYSDKVTKQFILNSKSEAEDAGLSSNSYILKSDYASNASANLSSVLYNFIGGYIYGNIYLETLGFDGISEEQAEGGNCEYIYFFNASYSYSGESGTRVKEEIDLNYTLNKERNRLLNFNYSYLVTETNESNPEDCYTSGFANESTISYGEKSNTKTDILNVDDYFLRTITEIKLKARNSNFDDIEVDPESISLNYSYVFAYASKYYPAKAVDIELIPYFSNNTNVIALNNGMFQIIGEGSATLYFSYYQKIDGVYEIAYKTIKVTVTSIKVESISFGIYDTNMYQQYGLCTSLTYDWPIYVYPSKADGQIIATSSDENVLKVTVTKEKEVKLIPVSEGKVTVTVKSVTNPEATCEKEFYVLNPNTNWNDYLKLTTFEHKSPYGYSFTMTFNSNGTGTRIRTISETGEKRTDTFSYSIHGNVITFANFSSKDDNSYIRGTIIKDFSKEGEPFGIYCETNEKGQVYYTL